MAKKLMVLLSLLMTAMAVVADPVGDFSLPDLQGKQHTLEQYRGKWIVINYWATDCPPCVQEIPELVKFHDRHKDKDAVVLGVNYEDIKLSWLKDFIASMHMNYPILVAEKDKVTPFGSIVMLPTTILVSPEGQLTGVQRGAVTDEALEHFLAQQAGKTAKGS